MALVSVPLTCFFSTVVLALQPVPVVLLLAETARKVVSYSFAKPAREMLFTQLSSDVKYKSKLVLDTVVQRGGDALGAALFSLLGAIFLVCHIPLAHSIQSSPISTLTSVPKTQALHERGRIPNNVFLWSQCPVQCFQGTPASICCRALCCVPI